MCERPVGVFAGIKDGKIVSGNLRCGSWTCPECQDLNKKILYSRIHNGSMSTNAVPRHGLKFLTLTYPGKAQREGKAPIEIYREMSKAFNLLMNALRKTYGKFDYFRISEPQRDGTPHFHVMLSGRAVVPKKILDTIENLWRNHYLMGYVKLNSVRFKDQHHAISYMLKYITKKITVYGQRTRLFTASRQALAKKIKSLMTHVQVYQGPVDIHKTHSQDLPKVQMIKAYPGKRKSKIPVVIWGKKLTDPAAAMGRLITMQLNLLKKRRLYNDSSIWDVS